MQFCSLCVSYLCPGMMGTLSWAVLNVTTLSLTRGRLWRPWPRSGATLASAFYEKSDFSFFFPFSPRNCERRMSNRKDWQLDFALKKKKPLNQSHKRGTCSCQYARRHSQRSGRPPASDTWAARNSRLSFAVVDLERGLKGVHHHLHDSLRCRCHYLWDYFFSLSSKCNTFLLIMTKHLQKRERWSWYKLQLLLYALWLLAYIEQWASMLPPIAFQR